MPVAQGGPPPLRQALVLGFAALMTVGTILFLVLTTGRLLGGRPSVSLDAGDPTFRPGPAEEVAGFIADNDNPVVLQDLTGGDRDLWLNHLGDDPEEGWYAFGVRPATAPRSCVTEWVPAEDHFLYSCDDTIYPADGEGLPQFPVTIDAEGELLVVTGSRAGDDTSPTDDTTDTSEATTDPTTDTTEAD